MKTKDYPHWTYPNRRVWKQSIRKRWNEFRKAKSNLRDGSAFYPAEVYDWLKKTDNELDKINEIMKAFYKNA